VGHIQEVSVFSIQAVQVVFIQAIPVLSIQADHIQINTTPTDGKTTIITTMNISTQMFTIQK
jgi:hypothetical protein